MNLNTATYFKRAMPTVLSCIASAGVVATAVITAKLTPKAVQAVKLKTQEKDAELTRLETIQTAAPVYIPAIAMGAATIFCIISSNVLTRKQQTSLLGAYELLKQTHNRYRTAAKKVYGDDADSQIVAQMARDVFVHSDGRAIYSKDLDAKNEDLTFYDMYSNRYFNTTMAAVVNAEYHVNRNLALRGYVPLNEFYDFLGIDRIDEGDTIGWDIDNLAEYGYYWLDFENVLTELDDGMQCCTVSCEWSPVVLDTVW